MFLLHPIILWSHNTHSPKCKWVQCSSPMNTLTSQALLFPAEQRDPETLVTQEWSPLKCPSSAHVCSHWGQALGLYEMVPLPTILFHLSVGCVKVRDLSCHHGSTCRKAAPSWQIGSSRTASLTQHFPSFLCPFQIFCYNNENSRKNRDLLPLHGASQHEPHQTCFNEPHSKKRTRKCDLNY